MKGKEYIRPIPSNWWLQRPTWTRYMVRELTAVFTGAYAVFLLVLLYKARDPRAFEVFVQGLKSPISILFHVIALAMVLYHTFTWFSLLPQATPIWRGEERVSDSVLTASQWVAWLVVTLLVAWIAIGLA